ncbi:hypothetical protein GQR58_030225 [Nymphon striatum]|nr:hypothetical protein GQR58_030225 [Nymphon striatum]
MTLATSGPAIIQRLKAAGLSVRPTAPPSPLMQALFSTFSKLSGYFWVPFRKFSHAFQVNRNPPGIVHVVHGMEPTCKFCQGIKVHSERCLSQRTIHQNEITFQTSPNMNMFEEKRISLLKIHHFVKNGRKSGLITKYDNENKYYTEIESSLSRRKFSAQLMCSFVSTSFHHCSSDLLLQEKIYKNGVVSDVRRDCVFFGIVGLSFIGSRDQYNVKKLYISMDSKSRVVKNYVTVSRDNLENCTPPEWIFDLKTLNYCI